MDEGSRVRRRGPAETLGARAGAVWLLVLVLLSVPLRAAVGGPSEGALSRAALPSPEGPSVVASFSVLSDLVRQIGGTRARVRSLVGPGVEPHAYRPTADDARALGRADLVVVNGAGLEGWLERLVEASGFRGPLVVATRGLPLLPAPDGHGGDGDPGDPRSGEDRGRRQGPERWDPHAWMSVPLAIGYLENIEEALASADPAGAPMYAANAARYRARLRALDAWAARTLGAIPEEERTILVPHDALRYFARRYGVRVLALGGVDPRAVPSARELARAIRTIREAGIRALFTEYGTPTRLLERIAAESGVPIGGTLYVGTLSPPGGPTPDYEALIRHDVQTITDALRRPRAPE